MTAPITDHVFRTHSNGTTTGERSGIRPGMCSYLGRCDRPKGDHRHVRSSSSSQTQRAQR